MFICQSSWSVSLHMKGAQPHDSMALAIEINHADGYLHFHRKSWACSCKCSGGLTALHHHPSSFACLSLTLSARYAGMLMLTLITRELPIATGSADTGYSAETLSVYMKVEPARWCMRLLVPRTDSWNFSCTLQTKCCLLALDFDTDDYTCNLFSVILSVLR